jgi:hypothetical protein
MLNSGKSNRLSPLLSIWRSWKSQLTAPSWPRSIRRSKSSIIRSNWVSVRRVIAFAISSLCSFGTNIANTLR